MSESEVIAYVAGVLTIPAIQYVGWPYLKRYLGIKGKKGKKGKNGSGGNPGKVAKRYEIHVHLPKDEEESK